MSNHGLSSEQARAIGAKTLWIGDIETWMDEQYIMGLFNKVSQPKPWLSFFSELYLKPCQSPSSIHHIHSPHLLQSFFSTPSSNKSN